jgi:hypothetical protein
VRREKRPGETARALKNALNATRECFFHASITFKSTRLAPPLLSTRKSWSLLTEHFYGRNPATSGSNRASSDARVPAPAAYPESAAAAVEPLQTKT